MLSAASSRKGPNSRRVSIVFFQIYKIFCSLNPGQGPGAASFPVANSRKRTGARYTALYYESIKKENSLPGRPGRDLFLNLHLKIVGFQDIDGLSGKYLIKSTFHSLKHFRGLAQPENLLHGSYGFQH
jgi:hypothetical protein